VHGVAHQTDEQIVEKAKQYASYALSAERIAV